MASLPQIFISATSGDLHSVRQLVKEALLTINCHPVEQNNFEPDWRTVEEMLRAKIADCQALIHIAGFRYGAEPDPTTLPNGLPRRSYTQIEHTIARQLQDQRGERHFRVYVFLCPENFPFDRVDAAGKPLTPEPEEKRRLQQQHRSALIDGHHLYEQPPDPLSLKARIHALREEILSLQNVQERKRRFTVVAAGAILVALIAIAWTLFHLSSGTTKIAERQQALQESFNLARLTEQVLTTYQQRFNELRQRSKDLPNTTIDQMVRAELPEILRISPQEVKAILEVEAPKLAGRLDTPIDLKLSALFVMGQYQAVLEQGETRLVDPTISGLHTMGDAALARFDEQPDEQLLEDALRYYEGAAALVSRERDPQAWAKAKLFVAKLAIDLGRYTDAESLLKAIIEVTEETLGKNSPELVIPLNNLGVVLAKTGRLDESEQVNRRALDIDKKAYGEDHPEVAKDLNNLGQLLQRTNRFDEAEAAMRKALEIDLKAHGREHRYVAIDLINLAQLLKDTNRLTEVEPLLRRAVEIDTKAYGEKHPAVARDLNNLATFFYSTSRFQEAEPLMKSVVDIFEKSYGHEHPTVATALTNLGLLFETTNRLDEAEPQLRRAVEIDKKAFGENHPDTAVQLNNLATLYFRMERFKEAESLMRRSAEILEASYGEHHPLVARAINNLAQLLQETNRLDEAEPLMRRALEIYERAHGRNHFDVALMLHNLGDLLLDTNRASEAEPLVRRSLGINEQSYGKNSPEVVSDLDLLARLLRVGNRTDEARALSERSVPICFKAIITGTSPSSLAPRLRTYVLICRDSNISDEEIRRRLEMIRGETGLDQKPFETVLNVILKETQVVVGEVMPGAQGASLGLLAGDIVYRYAGHRISTVRQLTKIIEDIQKGPVELEIQRESQMLRLSAKPGRLGILIKEGPVSPSEQK